MRALNLYAQCHTVIPGLAHTLHFTYSFARQTTLDSYCMQTTSVQRLVVSRHDVAAWNVAEQCDAVADQMVNGDIQYHSWQTLLVSWSKSVWLPATPSFTDSSEAPMSNQKTGALQCM